MIPARQREVRRFPPDERFEDFRVVIEKPVFHRAKFALELAHLPEHGRRGVEPRRRLGPGEERLPLREFPP